MSGHKAVFVPVALLAALVVALGGLVVTGLGMTAAASVDAHLTATAGCGKAPTLASGTHTIQSNGQNRNYILRIPTNYDNNHPYRLIFGFHWVGGTANDVDSGGTDGYNWSYYGLRRLADTAGNTTIFIAPQGNNNGWANPGGQDITFVDDITKQLEGGLCVDTTQLFSAGFSYGGAMTYALACARPTTFRAVAVYSGANLSGCNGGTQPIAYIGLHGLRDNVLPIANGRALRDTFVHTNACTPQNPPEPTQGSLTHITTTYTGCKPGYPVEWAAFDGAGHDPGPIDGCTCDGWHTWTSSEVWKFFTQFDSTTPPPTSTTPPPSGACSAAYRTVNSWQGGFQGEVTVTAGSAAVNGWTVHWTLDSGQTISQMWNGTLTATGSSVSITNVSYNGALPAAGSTTFGFLANGTPPTAAPSCTSP
ncbi:poly(3-hydroxybutyrate) depolymerase [Kutzneria buriramensis]|uniref:Poly(3-hydroxybutyrate) depolymerase n=2 Tax=Kutzneria buriramensis TaxID=1045776 RepID=A0A3E0GTI9_9PSEU|nr:cellulose binding domain-containing protein [Kutzneria buriramensis]REH26402.1 poly(3-hydroxybutyrate) depolymerase [Kutzneria buriramensis]